MLVDRPHDTAAGFSSLFHLYIGVLVAVVVLVFGAVGIAVFRFRRREGHEPSRRDSAPVAEGVYLAILAVVALGLIAATFRTEGGEDGLAARPGLEISVTAYQWSWRFDYPAAGVVVDGGAVAAASHRNPTLVVPAGTVVQFSLRSRDVLHSFFIPDMRFKRYAFPDHTNVFDLEFAKSGRMPGACAQFCGWDHAEMRFDVLVLPPSRFEAWLSAGRRA
jgi:cytochrome c oxidase subunit II